MSRNPIGLPCLVIVLLGLLTIAPALAQTPNEPPVPEGFPPNDQATATVMKACASAAPHGRTTA